MRQIVQTFIELTKARLAALVVVTAMVGFVVARPSAIDTWPLFWTTVGTTLAAFGANAFNQCLERSRDARMLRTRERPLPSGRLSLNQALWIAGMLSSSGIAILAWRLNLLTAGLALLIHFLYLLVYTPMKPRSPANTLVGAVCGAIPPVMGWTAATGSIAPGAGLLFLVLFAWQMPHFLALAWLYREDYARGGYRMLPAVDASGVLTGNLVVLYSALLVPLGLAFLLAGLAGWMFLAGGFLLSGWILAMSLRLRAERTDRSARRLFFTSLIYLPLFLGLLVLDRGPIIDISSGVFAPTRPVELSVVSPAKAATLPPSVPGEPIALELDRSTATPPAGSSGSSPSGGGPDVDAPSSLSR
jgi:protoheme IX farnesyltransferase